MEESGIYENVLIKSACIVDLRDGKTVPIPSTDDAVLTGLTLQDEVECVPRGRQEEQLVITLFQLRRLPDGMWISPNPDLPCLLNDVEMCDSLLLSQGSTIKVGDRYLRYNYTTPSRRKSAVSAESEASESSVPPPKPRRTPQTPAEGTEQGKEDSGDAPDGVVKLTYDSGWCVVSVPTLDEELMSQLHTSDQIANLAASYISRQLMIHTDIVMSSNDLDMLFKVIQETAEFNEHLLLDFAVEYHQEARLTGMVASTVHHTRPIHRPIINLLTELLKVTLEPVSQNVFWMRLLNTFSHFTQNVGAFLEFQTAAIVMGTMACHRQVAEVQQHGSSILAQLALYRPLPNEKAPVRESGVELLVLAMKNHSEDILVLRPACRALANVATLFSTIVREPVALAVPQTPEAVMLYQAILDFVESHALPAVIAVMKAHPDDYGVNAEGRRLLICFDHKDAEATGILQRRGGVRDREKSILKRRPRITSTTKSGHIIVVKKVQFSEEVGGNYVSTSEDSEHETPSKNAENQNDAEVDCKDAEVEDDKEAECESEERTHTSIGGKKQEKELELEGCSNFVSHKVENKTKENKQVGTGTVLKKESLALKSADVCEQDRQENNGTEKLVSKLGSDAVSSGTGSEPLKPPPRRKRVKTTDPLPPDKVEVNNNKPKVKTTVTKESKLKDSKPTKVNSGHTFKARPAPSKNKSKTSAVQVKEVETEANKPKRKNAAISSPKLSSLRKGRRNLPQVPSSSPKKADHTKETKDLGKTLNTSKPEWKDKEVHPSKFVHSVSLTKENVEVLNLDLSGNGSSNADQGKEKMEYKDGNSARVAGKNSCVEDPCGNSGVVYSAEGDHVQKSEGQNCLVSPSEQLNETVLEENSDFKVMDHSEVLPLRMPEENSAEEEEDWQKVNAMRRQWEGRYLPDVDKLLLNRTPSITDSLECATLMSSYVRDAQNMYAEYDPEAEEELRVSKTKWKSVMGELKVKLTFKPPEGQQSNVSAWQSLTQQRGDSTDDTATDMESKFEVVQPGEGSMLAMTQGQSSKQRESLTESLDFGSFTVIDSIVPQMQAEVAGTGAAGFARKEASVSSGGNTLGNDDTRVTTAGDKKNTSDTGDSSTGQEVPASGGAQELQQSGETRDQLQQSGETRDQLQQSGETRDQLQQRGETRDQHATGTFDDVTQDKEDQLLDDLEDKDQLVQRLEFRKLLLQHLLSMVTGSDEDTQKAVDCTHRLVEDVSAEANVTTIPWEYTSSEHGVPIPVIKADPALVANFLQQMSGRPCSRVAGFKLLQLSAEFLDSHQHPNYIITAVSCIEAMVQGPLAHDISEGWGEFILKKLSRMVEALLTNRDSPLDYSCQAPVTSLHRLLQQLTLDPA